MRGPRFLPEPALAPGDLPGDARAMLDEARRAVGACDGGLDDVTLRRIKDALYRVVPFDRIALHIEDEGGASFWVLWRDTAPSATGADASAAPRAAFATGVHVVRDRRPNLVARPGHALVVEDVDPQGDPIDRALVQAGVHSYLVFPLVRNGVDVASLTLAHEARGAPSQRSLALLMALGRILAPALLRARERTRGRLFESLVEEAPDGMLALDAAGTAIEANRAALRLLGLGRGQVIGHTMGALLGQAAREALVSPWEGAPKTLNFEAQWGRPEIDVVVARVDGMSDAVYRVHLQDARPRRAAELATVRRVDHFAFLRGLSESMAGDLHVETALERAATFCAGRPEVGGVMMFRAETGDDPWKSEGTMPTPAPTPIGGGASKPRSDGEDSGGSANGDGLHLVVAKGVSERTKRRIARVTRAELEGMLDSPAADVRRAHGVVEAVGATIDAETTGLVPRWKILVPLAHARRPLGAMLVLGKPGATLSESERDLWESVAGTISAALHAADDFEHVVALEAEKRQLVDNLPVIVARLDPKTGATLFVNGAIERVLGFSAIEVQGQPGMDGLLADPIEWEASAVARDRAARGHESAWQDRRYRHKDGRVLTLRESIYPVRDPAGTVRAIQVIAYDVSTELESRKQLMQADRLASLGALAGGIAHEINNPVAFIGLAASQLTRMLEPARGAADPADRERAKQLLQEVSEATARIGNIVGELKLFTRIPEGAHVTPVDISRIVQMAVTLTSAELRRWARVEMNLAELPLVPGEFSSLGQAFVNLLLNAAQAVHAKQNAGAGPCFVRVSTFVDAGAIVVRVSDTGVGIEPRLLPRIFDPFFKTRASGEGAGLGLAIAHNLVRRVGGDIRVTSEPGEGSTFDVILPLDAAQAALEAVPRASPSTTLRAVSIAPAASRGRVLIVDDEQALAKALARQLADRWDVDTVSTARDALAELSVHRYDVVACDLRMPDQSGPAIYEATRARSPRQASRFVFTTGGSFGSSDDEIHARAEATRRPILEKPFDGATFEALVAQVAAQKD
jgi:PAS domain S-box-containing protein